MVGGDDGLDDVAEGDVDGWQVVECADHHAQVTVCGPDGLGGDAGHQVGMQPAARESDSAARRQPKQIGDGGLIPIQVGVEHRTDETRAAFVRFSGGVVALGCAQHSAEVGIDRAAQRLAAPSGLPELRGEIEQCGAVLDASGRRGDRVQNDILVGEMLKERYQVGEGFMPCEHVRVRGDGKVPAEPVNKRMGDFVGDDVRRQAGEDHLAGQIGAGILQIGAVVAEQHRLARRVEVGVAALERVRNEAQLLVATPAESSAEVPLESLDDARRDRVDDLLM